MLNTAMKLKEMQKFSSLKFISGDSKKQTLQFNLYSSIYTDERSYSGFSLGRKLEVPLIYFNYYNLTNDYWKNQNAWGLERLLAHEIAHFWQAPDDPHLIKSYRLSYLGGEAAQVSNYAGTSLREDFAESVAAYFVKRVWKRNSAVGFYTKKSGRNWWQRLNYRVKIDGERISKYQFIRELLASLK